MGSWCWSTLGAIAWIWHLLIGKNKKTHAYTWVLQLHWLQAFYFVFIMEKSNTWKKSEWTWDWNHLPYPLLLMARKMPFLLKNFKNIVTFTTSTVSSLCTLPTDNLSTLVPSQVERTALAWYWASCQEMGAVQPNLQLCLAEVYFLLSVLWVRHFLEGFWFRWMTLFLIKKKSQIPKHGKSDKIFCVFCAFGHGRVQSVVAQFFLFFICLMPSLLYAPFQWQQFCHIY